jgi:hypothetical protein
LETDSYIDPSVRNLIVLDDLMATVAKDPRITDLFTEGSHHKNLSVVVLNQNLYYSKDPTQRRNCQYLVLFNNPVDKQQISTLGRQMYPGKVPYFLQIFEEATARDYGILLLDLKPTTSESNRLRSNVLDIKQEDDVIPMANGIRIKEQEDNVHSFEDKSSEQTREFMPSCDDCGVVLDSMHDLQRHIKTWCPESESLKRKREDEDISEDNTSERSRAEWIEYDNSDDSSEFEDDDIDENEGYKALINESVDSTEKIWDAKYKKYLEKGMDEEDAMQQSNEKITPLVQRQFLKRYGDVLKLIVHLNKSSIHRDNVRQIEDLIDDAINEETAIQRVLKRSRHQFDILFDDDYFEINNDENNDQEEYSDDEHEED